MIGSDILVQIQNDLTRLSTEDAKAAFAKFVPNSQNVYGVRLPIINNLAKRHKEYDFSLIQELWSSGAFEERMLAIKLLNKNCKKDPNLTLELLHNFSQDVNDWAICDTLCSEGIRPILKIRNQELWQIASDYLASDSMWVRRMGIVIFIHFAKIPERKEEVRLIVEPLKTDKEMYIKKAMVWIKRYLDK